MGSEVEIQPNNKKKRRNSLCVGCGSPITDQYILRVAPDLEWHAACLKCADCDQYLDESCTCFVRDGKTYCKRDYVRLFGTKCAKCLQGFCKNDFVMRARSKIYHIDCFRCVTCARQLIPGDEFALRDDGLFCKADHGSVDGGGGGVARATDSPTANSTDDGKEFVITTTTNTNNNNNNNNNDTKNSTKHSTGDSSRTPTTTTTTTTTTSSSGGGGRSGRAHKSEQKTTRVRTVLNEKQLHTLRTCYGANPRPDALMKEQLTEMTGLSSRVIRVWFQNKRCKDKKRSIFMKQMHQQQQEKGVPMVASSPIRHDPPANMQPTPVEVQSYPAPWKALSEFALQSDLDQQPYRQLVHGFGGGMPGFPHGAHFLMDSGDFYYNNNRPGSVSSDSLPLTPSDTPSPLSQ